MYNHAPVGTSCYDPKHWGDTEYAHDEEDHFNAVFEFQDAGAKWLRLRRLMKQRHAANELNNGTNIG